MKNSQHVVPRNAGGWAVRKSGAGRRARFSRVNTRLFDTRARQHGNKAARCMSIARTAAFETVALTVTIHNRRRVSALVWGSTRTSCQLPI